MITPIRAGDEVETHADECQGQRQLDESGAACRERAARQHVPAGVGEHEGGDADVIVADTLQRGPQADDVAGPVDGVSEHSEAVLARTREQPRTYDAPATPFATLRRTAPLRGRLRRRTRVGEVAQSAAPATGTMISDGSVVAYPARPSRPKKRRADAASAAIESIAYSRKPSPSTRVAASRRRAPVARNAQ